MAHVQLEGSLIKDRSAFHDHCAAAFGFPAFYGRNMDAWIDCLTYVRTGDGMSRFALGPDEQLVIELVGSQDLKDRLPDIFDALIECTIAVNKRYVDTQENAPLQLLLR